MKSTPKNSLLGIRSAVFFPSSYGINGSNFPCITSVGVVILCTSSYLSLSAKIAINCLENPSVFELLLKFLITSKILNAPIASEFAVYSGLSKLTAT